ncbi:MAG: anti-sigma factor, partial [Terriglobales bacterium]
VVLLLNTDQRLSRHIRALNSQIAALQTDAHNMRIAMHREITIAEVVTAQDTIAVNLAPQPGQQRGTARVLYRPRTGFVVYTGSLAPVPPSKSYQLWLVPAAGNPISAGVLQSPSGTFIAHVPAGTLAKAFAITLEPHGGMPQPTGAKVVVGAVAST